MPFPQDGERPYDRGEEVHLEDPAVERRIRVDRRDRFIDAGHIGEEVHPSAFALNAGKQVVVRVDVGKVAVERSDTRGPLQGFHLDIYTEYLRARSTRSRAS